ncbi:HK97-gp10 family putative phage morphogenesis protein [Shinella zoogloeoides]|uniref:HK97-gp10 family putative phage morphogenesis protein n=1 Tax=Shinella zoogloeoides TaxID=352475 RepID=UPI001F57EF90|nr:HK97-gp10 family putative phage morphogenesis protein [Shinella zoogloeoides]
MAKQSARLQRRLAAIPKAAKQAVAPALTRAGVDLAMSMRFLAPVDSGDLRDSITVTAPGEQTPPYSQPGGSRVAGELEVIVTAGNEDVRYPHLVEYGAANAPAQPFFWPAFRLKRKVLAQRVKRAVRKAVKEAK